MGGRRRRHVAGGKRCARAASRRPSLAVGPRHHRLPDELARHHRQQPRCRAHARRRAARRRQTRPYFAAHSTTRSSTRAQLDGRGRARFPGRPQKELDRAREVRARPSASAARARLRRAAVPRSRPTALDTGARAARASAPRSIASGSSSPSRCATSPTCASSAARGRHRSSPIPLVDYFDYPLPGRAIYATLVFRKEEKNMLKLRSPRRCRASRRLRQRDAGSARHAPAAGAPAAPSSPRRTTTPTSAARRHHQRRADAQSKIVRNIDSSLDPDVAVGISTGQALRPQPPSARCAATTSQGSPSKRRSPPAHAAAPNTRRRPSTSARHDGSTRST